MPDEWIFANQFENGDRCEDKMYNERIEGMYRRT